MTVTPFDILVGGDLDTVSFVRDCVELRVDYSIVRLFTSSSGVIDGVAWHLTDTSGADLLRPFIGRTVVAADFVEGEHLELDFDADAYLEVSLRLQDRSGLEALHLMPADELGGAGNPGTGIWKSAATGPAIWDGLGVALVRSH